MASDRLRSRPNTSISQAARPTCAEYSAPVVVALPESTIERAPLTWTIASTDGSAWARWIRYWARAASIWSTALRRSRLWTSACSRMCCRRGSRTNARHGSAVAVPLPPGRLAGTGAAGRW